MELITSEILTRKPQAGSLSVFPIGDVQYTGADGSTVLSLLHTQIQRGLECDGYFIGMGDYIDFASPSNRSRLKSANLYDTATAFIDDAVHHLNHELFEKVLKPTKGRWLGLLQGHHFHKYETGKTSDMELCEWLEAPFLGTCAYRRIMLTDKNNHRIPWTIWCHHGQGGGITAGAPLLKLERMANYWDADVFLIGHQSKLVSAPIERIYPVWDGHGLPRLQHRKILLACTGSFSRGYIPHQHQGGVPQGDYVEQKMLTPVALGGIKVTFSWQVRRHNGERHLTKDITVEL